MDFPQRPLSTPASSQQVLQASRQWLRPVIHVLLRCGVTWREFADLARATYVEVASAKFGKRGRPTNVSRTAVLTGLSRRDVRKQRELLAGVPPAPGGYVTKASLVLSAWHQDPEFLDSKGRPALLPLEGAQRSFAALVHRCAGSDVPATTLVKELISAGAVRARPDGRLQVLQRNYIPHPMDEHLIRLWGSVLADVATTYAHNLTKTPRHTARFERAAVNDRIDVRAVPEFTKFLEQEAQGFLERADAWLTEHQVPVETQREAETVRLGVGTYHIQDE
jgi:hypothetical protein